MRDDLIQLRHDLEGRAPEMLDAIRKVVEAESPTSDLVAVSACADVVSQIGEAITGSRPERISSGGRPHLLWRLGPTPPLGLLGHFDTVWPLGTLPQRPYREADGRAFGPGIFDMKCGVVQAFHAAAANPAVGVDILLTSDEEAGSLTSRKLVEELAREWRATLVLEASHHGALKVARKGVSVYRVSVEGREAHAGLEPEKGVNALVELAHVIVAVDSLASPSEGTSVSCTVAHGGTAANVIPSEAQLEVDVRTFTDAEMDRVHSAINALEPVVPGATITVTGGPNRPPLSASMSADLFDVACQLNAGLGYGDLEGVTVGGGSDGNLTAAVGTPTLDGLGAVGDGAHAVHEHVVIEEIPRRAALVAALIREIAR